MSNDLDSSSYIWYPIFDLTLKIGYHIVEVNFSRPNFYYELFTDLYAHMLKEYFIGLYYFNWNKKYLKNRKTT